MNQRGIHATKQVFMALVNSYAACGNLEKAKQVWYKYHTWHYDYWDLKGNRGIVRALNI